MSTHPQSEKAVTLKRRLARYHACNLLKDVIKNESDSEYKYTKIKEDMPIEYMEYYTDFDIIRANRGKDKKKLMEIAKEIECPP